MPRWTRRALPALLLAVAGVASAQMGREAPKDVVPALIAISATPPVIAVNGQPDRFSPGVRIRDLNNMLVLTGNLAGRTVYSVYRRDGAGLVHEVWLLTADEYRKLGGYNASNPGSVASFVDALNLIFNARATGTVPIPIPVVQ